MTPLREAFILPGLFLTVTLLGGLRVDDAFRLLPPPLSALVLAVILVGALVRAGVVAPAVLLAAERNPLENLSGAVVLMTLLAATAQTINLVVPERGLLHFAFAVFLFVQLLSLTAARIDRAGMLRSLFVLLGASFVLRFIVLESLYAADGGALKRVLTALMAGVTLGAIEYHPHGAVTGYVACLALALYMIGLVLLPVGPSATTSAMTRGLRQGLQVPLLMIAVALAPSACQRSGDGSEAGTPSDESRRAAEQRRTALATARVWMPPAVPPAAADLGVNPATLDAFPVNQEISCRFVVETVGGLTPKFNCELDDGTVVKVKYGAVNAELPSEVATTRLLTALGFGADRMYIVRAVRCAGCPLFPYPSLRCLAKTGLQRACFPTGINYEKLRTFDPVVIERRLEGRKIEATPDQGWAWFELDQIDPAQGGSPRVEVDALKLLAVLLAHWDNKAENQRLVCLPGGDLPDGGCTRSFAMIQDAGAMFGPNRVDLHNWRVTPVWVNPRECRVSMETLPYEGATFPEQQISEGGRQFLLRLIEQLSITQLETLFSRSRIPHLDQINAEGRNPAAWVAAFLDKVGQIREAGPCPQKQSSVVSRSSSVSR